VSFLTFFEFRLYCPHATEVAWKRLLDVTDNRVGKKLGLQDFVDVVRDKNVKYYGYLRPYEFEISPISKRRFLGFRKQLEWKIYGKMEPFMNGCTAKGYVRPLVSFLVFMGLLLMVFIMALYNYFYEPQPGAEIGLVAVAAMFLVMLGLWVRASVKCKNTLCELLDGKVFEESGGGMLQLK